jgi:2-deoxy-D-gluconate 3-dehydrogenase
VSPDRRTLDGQVAIVTGASSGLGRIMAVGLAEAGCAVVLASRREDELEATAAHIVEGGGRAAVVSVDVRERGHGEHLVERADAAFGRLDGVVLNAGVTTGAPAEDEDLDAFGDVLDVNVTAQMELASAAARYLIEAGHGGWMVAMSSILGRRAATGMGLAAYTASKGAIEQLVRELGRQWAGHGIRVNGLAPGYFPTPMNAPMVAAPGRLEAMLARIPLGRAGAEADIAGPAVFLASDAAGYSAGHTIAVGGGMGAW